MPLVQHRAKGLVLEPQPPRRPHDAPADQLDSLRCILKAIRSALARGSRALVRITHSSLITRHRSSPRLTRLTAYKFIDMLAQVWYLEAVPITSGFPILKRS